MPRVDIGTLKLLDDRFCWTFKKYHPMEAKTNLKSRLASRHVTEEPGRAPHRSYYYAMGLTDEQIHQPFVGVASCRNEAAPCNIALMHHECRMAFDLFDVAEVFKRTPYIADLKPGGRFVAKDLFEAGKVPLLMKTLLDNGFLHCECLTVTGCSMAENLYRVAWNSGQDVGRPADHVGPEAAVGGPIGFLRDGDMISINVEDGNFDVQLNNVELEKRRAAWQPRGAAFGSGYLWKYAQQVGSARHGAVTRPGGSAEKTCYADI
jgi:dihydroxyacid dehydratase/phosphogluconate dehydratase